MLAALLLAAALQGSAPEPARQFDFWVGEWQVLNRHQRPDGTWKDGDTTRARITPVCGGAAILEEWAGPFRGSFMNGFSLRSYDPGRERWTIVLFWTTDGNASFGVMNGDFRHGRAEFVAPESGPNRTRYTFSDALPSTVRWDSATTQDGGVTWSTSWIMEFTRTRAAAETTQERFFDEAWTTGTVSPHAEARALDGMLGEWNGFRETADGERREARLRAKLLDKDCLVLDVLATRAPGTEDWDERATVRGYVAQRGTWEAWRVSESDPRLRRSLGTGGDPIVFERRDPETSALVREVVVPLGGGELVIEETEERDGAEPRLLARTTLERVER